MHKDDFFQKMADNNTSLKKLRYTFSNRGTGRPYSRADYEELLKFRTKDNACVVFDGCHVIFASESERFTGIRHDHTSPFFNLEAFKAHSGMCGIENLQEIEESNISPNHHENHIYECFYQSGFKDAAIIVNDGMGNLDDCVTLAYVREGEKPIVFKKYAKDNSPCRVYGRASKEIFGNEFSEGKLMGLAAYGEDNGHRYVWYDDEKDEIEADFGILLDDIDAVRSEFTSKSGGVMCAKDIAFVVQKDFVLVVKELAKRLKALLDDCGIKTENLCLSGGGVLNCPANSAIVDLNLFKNYYASPQPSDGCAESVGWSLRNMFENGEKIESVRLKTPYLGVKWPSENLIYEKHKLKDPINHIVRHLKKGGVVAWYQDEAEFGPRALGHRSFLADPSRKDMLDSLNKIKGRENWRPLAPVVPDRLFPLIFVESNYDMCEFMLRTLDISPKWQNKLMAVCHTDGTTRPQLLKRGLNPQLYDLLMSWFEETGTPCLVNTSLNINGYPMVETPRNLCELKEEVSDIEDVPDVMAIFIDEGKFFEIQ